MKSKSPITDNYYKYYIGYNYFDIANNCYRLYLERSLFTEIDMIKKDYFIPQCRIKALLTEANFMVSGKFGEGNHPGTDPGEDPDYTYNF